MGRTLRCYAWGNEDGWEARCIDLDLAVTGRDADEVRMLLNEAIRTYVADVIQEAPQDHARLLNRRAPLFSRLGLCLVAMGVSSLRLED